MQSVSKPAVYAAALADQGREGVLRKVGVEPSGEAFNSISLDPHTGAPLNPMINAGAIATTGLVSGANAAEQWERVADIMAAFFGRAITVDEAVYRSESETVSQSRHRGCSRTSASSMAIHAGAENYFASFPFW
jgi:glutaminase